MDLAKENAPDHLERLARSYKTVVALVGAQLCVTGLPLLLGLVGREFLFPIVVALLSWRPLVLLITVVTIPVFAYRVFDALGSKLKVLWAALAIIPIINLFVLGWMSRKAARKCEEFQIAVGLLGPKL